MVQAQSWSPGAVAAYRSPVMPRVRPTNLALLDARDARVESIWHSLEQAARPAYFLTWGWIKTWLAELPAASLPKLAVLRDGKTAIAAGFLGRCRTLRHGVMPVRGAFLNATGLDYFDELCVEHNGMLCRPGAAWPLPALLELLPRDWDELVLPAIDGAAYEALEVSDYQVQIDREVAAPYVDLARVREAGDYLSLIGANTRSQLRRARKLLGPLELEAAQSPSHAGEILDELIALHGARWTERGQPGAFANPWFTQFHRRLIEQRFAHGEIELLRLRAGNQTVGCIYNLIANGRVLFYQSGLTAFADPRIKPGYLCQAAAIERAAAAGHAIYDFLGGASRYKASLATDATRLAWLRVQRPLKRFAIENQLVRWKRDFTAWRAARAG